MYKFYARHFSKKNFAFANVINNGSDLRRPLMKKGLVYLFALLAIQLSVFGQNKISNHKIDPVFRYILEHSTMPIASLKENLPSYSKIEPSQGFAGRNASPEERYECIVYTKNAKALQDAGIILNSVLPGFATAWVTLDQIVEMSLMPQVTYIDAPKTNYLHNDIAVGGTGASLLHQGKLNNTVYKGKNVIVVIYDTGIDWDHLDFRDPLDTTKSRILRIWDQTITAVAGEAPPSGFTYGVEYTQNQINEELDGSPANIVRERDTDGHGTHVAGTAAGNGSTFPSRRYTGMAPEADIVVIKGGNGTFSESRIIDGLTYVKNLATGLGKPAVVNWSLGSQFGAHDGTRAYELAVDNFTSSADGRVVVISAGNDNGSNIHNRLSLAGGASGSVLFSVSDSTASDVFEYRIYANDNSDVSAVITTPDGGTVTANAGVDIDAPVLSDSFTVSISNQVDPANNNRYVEVYLRRTNVNTRRPTGTWTLTLTNNSSNTLTMDGWLHYRNTAFTLTRVIGGNSDYIVGSPGNATSAITVASFIGRNNWYSGPTPGGFTFASSRIDSISSFSSRGPRRDGVLKPEIAAHGEAVVSCLSSNALASYATSSITDAGLYVKNQGTSMSAPGVAGAVALLLQAAPTATAAEIKNYITSTANKDGMTELTAAVPNSSWGYGKLDVFKAASLLFNCAPVDRRTIKYDSSTRNAQEVTSTLTTQRVAVRFTPDINGKLGGVFFHTSAATTGLFLEVRTNFGGAPGTLLGTLNIDSARIARSTFNYIDLSNLNISVTSFNDYFIVFGRLATSIASWTMRGEALFVDGRSFQSANDGATWSTLMTIDYKVRSVVYANQQTTGIIAAANSADSRSISTSNQFINTNCQLISQVIPNGINPVSGVVTSKVWIEGSVPHAAGQPFVQRHYEITPPGDASTATGKVTLYFTQAEFTSFNNDAGSPLDLPTGPADAIGIANLRIGKFTGSSNDDSGLPASYTTAATIIDPADGDIVWNAAANRWEVSFDVTGFSGFIAQTSLTALPIIVQYFRGNPQGPANILNWKVNCSNGSAAFEVERSDNGIDFISVGMVKPSQAGCSLPLNFKDASPTPGKNYYRIKLTENTGKVVYTNTIMLQNNIPLVTKLYPTIITKGSPVQVSFSGTRGNLFIHDAVGRQVSNRTVTYGVQSINLGLERKGLYFYTIKDDKKVLLTGKIIVE